jgi:CHAD domain-containing protein
MRLETSKVRPIQCFQQQVGLLKATFAACHASPTPGTVRRLRMKIRRIEAQMVLLNQLHDLPPHRHETKKLHQELRKARRCAGKVRDVDIQRELISRHDTSITISGSRRLRHCLKRERENEAANFRKRLHRAEAKVYLALDRLYEKLHSVEHLSLSTTEVVERARAWFLRHCRPTDTIEHLHTTRKAAKLARYMGETALGSTAAVRIAKSLEDIQRAGGQWHDWMQLVGITTGKLGKKHPLAKRFKHLCEMSLREYRTKIVKVP